MIGIVFRRCAVVLALSLAALAGPVMGPAWACGCGAYSPGHGGRATVPMETALVRVNADGTEDVYLSLSVDSTVRTGALLFPVPDKAATVTAGPTGLFGELATLTAPSTTNQAPRNGGKGAPNHRVTVVNRQQIGPLDVVTLSSSDPAALTQWLQGNGFSAKPALAAAARPYTSKGWAFVAVRLRPGGEAGPALSGTLDPLRIHFASKDVVYPMRLSAMATEPEQVQVYALAAHRLELHSDDPGMTVSWAGPLGQLSAYPDLAKVAVAGSRYLTRYDGRLSPASITDDFHFSPAASDAALRPRVVEDQPDAYGGDPPSSDHTVRDVALGVLALTVVLVFAAGLVRWQAYRQRQSG
ncbi:MAG: DUF2330 domain-containing protein [Pseudonocardiales bacterium]|nr:MAG: DUF2330 domain-containing protein [Pseudonocardiales bacterium]